MLAFRLVFCGAVLPCSVLRVVVWCPALLCCGLLRAVPCFLCRALGCCCLLCRVFGRVVRPPCSRSGLLFGFAVRCRVLWCAVCLGAELRRVAPPCVVLLCAVLFSVLRLVQLLAVLCPWALSVALGSCAFQRRVLWCFPALCALCCVCVAVMW